ncbi:hypothetical protein CWS02_23320 [Enterobacter sp. EA-1]|nr:hypothetical protein CWS02_23320 [Enterobacter sp. EA-1]
MRAPADSDPDAAFPVLLEDDSLYNRVEQEIQQRIDSKKLKRREWKFLCSSYFGYHAKSPTRITIGVRYAINFALAMV